MRTTVPVVQGSAKALRFFDRIAPWYDRINVRIYQRQWLKRVRAEIHGLRILDVGVGTGFTTGHLTASVGIDLSREMLKRARYQGHLIRADVMHPPFRPVSSTQLSSRVPSTIFRARRRGPQSRPICSAPEDV